MREMRFLKSMNLHLYAFITHVSMATLRSVEFRNEIPILMKSVYSAFAWLGLASKVY